MAGVAAGSVGGTVAGGVGATIVGVYGTLVLVTGRAPEEGLYRALAADPEALQAAGIRGLTAIGDCRQPSSVADAVYSGHRAARHLELTEEPPLRRERPAAD